MLCSLPVLCSLLPGLATQEAAGFAEVLNTFHDAGQFSGAVLVARDGEVLFEGAVGLANRTWDVPNTVDTKFRIGSLGKSFTAVTVMQLVEAGLIDLNAKVGKYLPEMNPAVADEVTIHQLLNMTGGLPSHIARLGPMTVDEITPAQLVERIGAAPLAFAPGTDHRYSNCSYHVLGAVVEAVTGKTLGEVLRQRTLVPLGMTDTGVERNRDVVPRLANGYVPTPDGVVNGGLQELSHAFASGDMYSTVRDLLKWDQALYGDALLSAASKRQMFYDGRSTFANMGYAWRLRDYRDAAGQPKKLVRHGGTMRGFMTNLERYVEDGCTIIVLSNFRPIPFLELANALQAVLFGRQPELPDREVSDELFYEIADGNTAEALAAYRAARDRGAEPPEAATLSLGMELLNSSEIPDADAKAIELLTLYTQLHSSSWRAHLLLGIGCVRNQLEQRAIASLERALELRPGDAEILGWLERARK